MANETTTRRGKERWNDEEMKILRRQMKAIDAKQAAYRIEMAAIAEVRRDFHELAVKTEAAKGGGWWLERPRPVYSRPAD